MKFLSHIEVVHSKSTVHFKPPPASTYIKSILMFYYIKILLSLNNTFLTCMFRIKMANRMIRGQVMTPEMRKSCLATFHLSDELATEIEQYVKYQKQHEFAFTTKFPRVLENIHGDEPLAWTAVQVYIHSLIAAADGTPQERVDNLYLLAFPQAENPKAKLNWLIQNQSMSYYVSFPYLFAYFFAL